MRVALLGLGLIGGSVARALREGERRGDVTIAAWTPDGRGPRAAADAGVVDVAAEDPAAAVAGADLVVIAAPPLAALDLVDLLGAARGGALGPAAVVTDVVSTKATIVARADAAGLPFVGGHPMAGRETAGFGAAAADLFAGRPWVIVPGGHARASDVARVEELAVACGARPVRMTAEEHDAAAAGISHAPLVVAAALVEAVAGAPGSGPAAGWAAARSLAATGWRDATRLARGDAVMAAGMLATNATATAARLRAVRDRLDAWIAVLEAEGGPDADGLRAALEADRDRLSGVGVDGP